jgi:pyridoxamine 5'-phosphate oxidase
MTDHDHYLAELRSEYMLFGLTEEDAGDDPIAHFSRWLGDALDARLPEPHAMTLATSTPDGYPSARMVLLRGFDAAGFVFYTNYDSRKGNELLANPRAALIFFWPELQRQVRVEGTVAPVSPEESDAYFASRPRGSQIGAWASRQSQVLPDRETLERRVMELETLYQDQAVPRPPNWGGYRVRPAVVEFWQGRASRLHDRLRFRLRDSGAWVRERLSP